MPAAARITDAVATGLPGTHFCDMTSTILGALASKVYTEGLLNSVKGDLIAPHTILAGFACIDHLDAVVNAGSGKVFVEGIAAARIDDSADMGKITGSASKVYFG